MSWDVKTGHAPSLLIIYYCHCEEPGLSGDAAICTPYTNGDAIYGVSTKFKVAGLKQKTRLFAGFFDKAYILLLLLEQVHLDNLGEIACFNNCNVTS